MKIYGRIEGDRRDEPDTTTPLVAMKVKNTLGMRARENSNSYNTKENTVIARKPT